MFIVCVLSLFIITEPVLSSGAKAGIVVGVLLLLVLAAAAAAAAAVFYYRRKICKYERHMGKYDSQLTH